MYLVKLVLIPMLIFYIDSKTSSLGSVGKTKMIIRTFILGGWIKVFVDFIVNNNPEFDTIGNHLLSWVISVVVTVITLLYIIKQLFMTKINTVNIVNCRVTKGFLVYTISGLVTDSSEKKKRHSRNTFYLFGMDGENLMRAYMAGVAAYEVSFYRSTGLLIDIRPLTSNR